MIRQRELEAELDKLVDESHKPLVKLLIDMQMNFDKLCLNLSKADGTMSFRELKRLSVYEFHLVKQNVMDNNKRQKGSVPTGEKD